MCKTEKYYLKLLDVSYDEAVIMLEKKNGKPDFDYYTEPSFEDYKKYLRKRINTTNGYKKRRKEGYNIHHILEYKYKNLSRMETIRNNNYPYCTQKSKYLVFVDDMEHAILHSLIAKETGGQFGIEGMRSIMGQIKNNNELKQRIIENIHGYKFVKSEEI